MFLSGIHKCTFTNFSQKYSVADPASAPQELNHSNTSLFAMGI